MNFREAWSYNLTIHHRNGMTLVRRPENPLLADIHLRMGLEVCLDNEAQTVLPEIAAVLEIPPQELYIEQTFWEYYRLRFIDCFPIVQPRKLQG